MKTETCDAASLNGLIADIDGDISYELMHDTALLNQYINCVMNCQEVNPDDPNCIMNCLDEAGILTSGCLSEIVDILKTKDMENLTLTPEYP